MVEMVANHIIAIRVGLGYDHVVYGKNAIFGLQRLAPLQPSGALPPAAYVATNLVPGKGKKK